MNVQTAIDVLRTQVNEGHMSKADLCHAFLIGTEDIAGGATTTPEWEAVKCQECGRMIPLIEPDDPSGYYCNDCFEDVLDT